MDCAQSPRLCAASRTMQAFIKWNSPTGFIYDFSGPSRRGCGSGNTSGALAFSVALNQKRPPLRRQCPPEGCGRAAVSREPEKGLQGGRLGAPTSGRRRLLAHLRWRSLVRCLLSPGGQRWQNWQSRAFWQPSENTKAHGLHAPQLCSAEPLLGISRVPRAARASAVGSPAASGATTAEPGPEGSEEGTAVEAASLSAPPLESGPRLSITSESRSTTGGRPGTAGFPSRVPLASSSEASAALGDGGALSVGVLHMPNLFGCWPFDTGLVGLDLTRRSSKKLSSDGDLSTGKSTKVFRTLTGDAASSGAARPRLGDALGEASHDAAGGTGSAAAGAAGP
mmetsp:Transcript_132147/g.358856  ORF Transcript_132147/g.358856 Transcript_132147/m.358856 type:complete len:338 (-) Transcript_132147:205-1218(-)